MAISTDAFIPNRGLQEQILAAKVENGSIYFSKDTDQIYCDIDGERHLMSNSGVRFIYGNATDEQVSYNALEDLTTIDKKYLAQDDDYPHYEVGFIIINKPNSTFYQIKELTDTAAVCEKLLVAGSGGGSEQSFFLYAKKGFTGSYNYNNPIVGTFYVKDNYQLVTEVDIEIQYYEAEGQENPKKIVTMSAPVGKDFQITLDNSQLTIGAKSNYIKIIASTSDGREAFQAFGKFQIFKVSFEPQTVTWEKEIRKIHSAKQNQLAFPWVVTVAAGSAPDGMSIQTTYYIDNTYIYDKTPAIESATQGSHDLTDFLVTENLAHGGHTLRVVAKMSYTNMPEGGELTVGDYTYGFGWADAEKATPVIWTDFHELEVENYTIIDIPYIVYDPNNETEAKVSFALNGVTQLETTYNYSNDAWGHWKVTEYIVGASNQLTITCGETAVDLTVIVLKNASVDLGAISNNAVLYLNALGRSNDEVEAQRQEWPNKVSANSNITVGAPQLTGFNWATNGWTDLSDEGVQVLRLNNGAKVSIPLKALTATAAQAQTYEFEFKVRNATNYSKLVNYTESVDEEGNPTITKTVSSGEGAFLRYYDTSLSRGILLGTQEAFFAIAPSSLLNARYTDEKKVKVSFVVNPKDNIVGGIPLIYVYINSVLTGVYNFTGQENNFTTNIDTLEINSDYCDVDIYNIRIYDAALTYSQITQNWVGDAPTLDERWNRYNKNQKILKDNDVDYTLVKDSGLIPIMVLSTYNAEKLGVTDTVLDDKLPYKKGAVKPVDVRFYYGSGSDMNFHAQNIKCDVQGTSSQAYPRRNYKIKLQVGDTTSLVDRPFKMGPWSGLEGDKDEYPEVDTENERMSVNTAGKKGKYNLGTGILEKTFCLKADFMESSSTHNTCLANYIQYLSEKTHNLTSMDKDMLAHPLIKDFGLDYDTNKGLRTTVYGFPMLLFHEKQGTDEIEYVGKYNFNLDKSDTDTFGFSNEGINKYTKEYFGTTTEIPYTGRICLRLDELLMDSEGNPEGETDWSKYWGEGTKNIAENLTSLAEAVNMYVYSPNAVKAQKIVKPLKRKNSLILNPSESGEKQIDNFANAKDDSNNFKFDPGIYIWEYTTDSKSWSIYKAADSLSSDGKIQKTEENALVSGITINSVTTDYTGNAAYISSMYDIEFETYNVSDSIETVQFYLVIADVANYPYQYINGTLIEAKPFSEVAECWEFIDNQAGMGKFQMPDYAGTDGFYSKLPETEKNAGRYTATTAFEMRYLEHPKSEYDILEAYSGNGTFNDDEARDSYKNLAAVWEWTASTNTADATGADIAETYYQTLSETYDSTQKYYYKKTDGTYDEQIITHTLSTTYKAHTNTESISSIDNVKFTNQVEKIMDISTGAGIWHFSLNTDNTWQAKNNEIIAQGITLSDWGITLPSDYAYTSFDIVAADKYDGFNTSLYEKFTQDTSRYRLSKFKNEFKNHWDLNYTAFYFVLTELLLMYDSRQKNMMIATWGPKSFKTETAEEVTPGDYIWYPIFYDMDTQLGINNSGQVYWDYDVDATPEAEGASSIFSGNGSVLWDNFFKCFKSDIQTLYRTLRSNGYLTLASLMNFYDTAGSDKWSEAMKNIDADFKYLAPADSNRGYIDIDGNTASCGGRYFYCLQGDRKLNRDAFLRNRLNYIDSQWLAGSYDPNESNEQFKLRYNLNDADKTSDVDFPSDATFTITPYLSQYVSVVYDETATTPQQFLLKNNTPVTVEPPRNIKQYVDTDITLSQQLAYIRGPEYLSDVGDLSRKYVNELDCTKAIRLKALRLGSEEDGYKNAGLSSGDLVIGGSADSQNSKQLLQFVDLTNLSGLTGNRDMSYCLKLQTFKALGTEITSAIFPNGNVLKRVYLPSTVTQLILQQPLVLTDLITDKANTRGENALDGLYIEGLTDDLGNLDKEVNNLKNNKIDKLQIEKSKLGFNSYKIFNYLYTAVNAKNEEKADNVADAVLSVQLIDVDWSEYKIVKNTLTNYPTSESELGNYYRKLNNETYEQLTKENCKTSDQWEQDLLDGIIYLKSDEDNPIENLDFLKQIINEYKDGNTSKEKFHFRNIVDNALNSSLKVVPKITGRIHVDNDEKTPISESDILNLYGLNTYFPDLEITANYITECPRVTFVEYATNTGAKTILAKQKKQEDTATEIVTYPLEQDPKRDHHDFQGWAIVGEGTGQIKESDVRKKCSVLTEEEKTNYTIYSTADLANIALDDSTGDVVFVAIYCIHIYNITFYEADNKTVFEIVGIESGKNMKAPAGEPYKSISGEGTTYLCNKFLGWTSSESSTTPLTVSSIRVSSDMEMYPLFEDNASVYDCPLSNEEMILVWDNDDNSWQIGIKPEITRKKEKICIPSYITVTDHSQITYGDIAGKEEFSGPVTQILGNVSSGNYGTDIDSSAMQKILYTSQGIKNNGFYDNSIITHIFFQGTMYDKNEEHKQCKIITFNARAFYVNSTYNSNLVYIDLPESLTSFGIYALTGCELLEITSLPEFTPDGDKHRISCSGLLMNCGRIMGPSDTYVIDVEKWPKELTLPYTVALLGSQLFADAGWNQYTIGTNSNPLTNEALIEYLNDTDKLWSVNLVNSIKRPVNITIYFNKSAEVTSDQVKQCFMEKIEGDDLTNFTVTASAV